MLQKLQVINQIIDAIQLSLGHAEEAATQARNLATDEQSKPETQYDTVAIEAAFLAQGQSERVTDLKEQLSYWVGLKQIETQFDTVKAGALFQLENESGQSKCYLLAQTSGGLKVGSEPETVYVITPKSPLGKLCEHKDPDDEIWFQDEYWTVTEIN